MTRWKKSADFLTDKMFCATSQNIKKE